MQNNDGELLQRVRERCLQDADNIASYLPFHLLSAESSARAIVPGKLWPPATDAQIDLTEEHLGFPLPRLLRNLYTQIANGGIGYICGALGGVPLPGYWRRNVVDAYLDIYWDEEKHFATQLPRTYIDLHTLPEAQQYFKGFTLQENVWPRYLVPFCYWGCNTEHAIDCRSGEIYVVCESHYFVKWVPTFEEWLNQWLDGTLKQEE